MRAARQRQVEENEKAFSLRSGALTELSGAAGCGKTEMLLELLAAQPRGRVAWVEEVLSIYPPALTQHQLGLENFLFIEAGQNLLWAAQHLLRSRLFSVVVLATNKIPDVALRRLQLAAEKAHASVVLLSEERLASGWAIAERLSIRRNLADDRSWIEPFYFKGGLR